MMLTKKQFEFIIGANFIILICMDYIAISLGLSYHQLYYIGVLKEGLLFGVLGLLILLLALFNIDNIDKKINRK